MSISGSRVRQVRNSGPYLRQVGAGVSPDSSARWLGIVAIVSAEPLWVRDSPSGPGRTAGDCPSDSPKSHRHSSGRPCGLTGSTRPTGATVQQVPLLGVAPHVLHRDHPDTCRNPLGGVDALVQFVVGLPASGADQDAVTVGDGLVIRPRIVPLSAITYRGTQSGVNGPPRFRLLWVCAVGAASCVGARRDYPGDTPLASVVEHLGLLGDRLSPSAPRRQPPFCFPAT